MSTRRRSNVQSLAERYRNLASYYIDHSKLHCADTATRLADAAKVLENKLSRHQDGYAAFTPVQLGALEHLLVDEGQTTHHSAQGPATRTGSAR